MLEENRNKIKTGSSIFVDFEFPKHDVNYIIEATNQEERVNAIEGELRLIKGRIYYIPVNNKEIDSDEFDRIKVFSTLSDKLNVVFIKDGYACVIPIVNNMKIRHKQHICNVVA